MKLTDDFKCPKCGGTRFTLAQDYIHYTGYYTEHGSLVELYTCEEHTDDEDARRFFCDDCDTYLDIPKGLG